MEALTSSTVRAQRPRANTVRVEAVAARGLLLRLAAVLSTHPVIAFNFMQRPDGTITLTVKLDEHACGPTDWHIRRVTARLRRVIGVSSADQVSS